MLVLAELTGHVSGSGVMSGGLCVPSRPELMTLETDLRRSAVEEGEETEHIVDSVGQTVGAFSASGSAAEAKICYACMEDREYTP